MLYKLTFKPDLLFDGSFQLVFFERYNDVEAVNTVRNMYDIDDVSSLTRVTNNGYVNVPLIKESK